MAVFGPLWLSWRSLAVAFGLLQVAIAAFAARNGAPGAAGVLLATWTFGSLVGGLVAGGRRWAAPVERRYVGLLLLLVGVFALLLLPRTNLQMGLLIALGGLPIAPGLLAPICWSTGSHRLAR
jgi:hypothetical protein